jgi:tRNA dimethylallyltransferase
MSGKRKIVFIFGPTGVGKSALAVNVSRSIGEIISVDSMQVYRGLELGTAKPDADALKAVPHHLVSIVEPDYRFSAGDFRRLALGAIEEIQSRGKLPVLVGGTGLYFKTLEYNFAKAPKADLRLRERLYRTEEQKRGSLYTRLASVDPDHARKLHPNDLLRIVRALEIYELSGRTFSSFVDGSPQRSFDILKCALMTDRELLYRHLEKRCLAMLAGGLSREVYGLLRRGCDEGCPAMKGLGYSHHIQYFKGCYSYDELTRLFIRDTKRYAKRQLTWFRRDEGAVWFRPEERDAVRSCILRFIASQK